MRVLARRSALPAALLAAGVLGILAAPAAWAGTPATTANDVCASNADPCNVTQSYDVTANAVLDFGTRTVNVTGSGEFDFGINSGRIACGNFSATTSGPFLNAAGPSPSSGTSGGSVLLLARRRCTSANPVVPCLDLSDCQLGPCGVRRCSGRSTKSCLADSDCQLGVCNALRRCSGAATLVRCSSNADCDYGTCPAQLTCTGRGDNPLNCATNSDCAFGTCTVGTASVTLNGAVSANSDNPASLAIRAADSVSIFQPINLNSTALDSDGGSLSVDARAGSITLGARINLTGGGDSQGGEVELNAGTDIAVNEDIDANGGDFDGGLLDFTSGRDITIASDLLASSTAGAGFGGEITINAGRDLFFDGVSTSNKSTMETSGHTDIENFSGDGGTLELLASRNLSFNPFTRLVGNGSIPDGTGGDVTVESGADLVMNGDVTAKSVGNQGSGGFVQVTADNGAASMGATSTFDVTGGSSGGGSLEIDSLNGDLTFDGECDVSGASGGGGGLAFLTARQAASLAGDLYVAGSGGGTLVVDACRLTLAAGASLDNSGTGGTNRLVTHDTMTLMTGSSMLAEADGTNTLRYRNSARPPVVQGTVSPTAALVVDPSLSDCPLCGNRAIDAGESCDDGNMANGDGCSADCQNENCLAQTMAPGYPTVALCEDGNVCTDDVCNTSIGNGVCQHPAKNCDDAVACTIDACDTGDGTCRHSASDSACSDANDCTDDFCSLSSGCSNTANSGPCDDDNRCTANDVCADKACHGTRIGGCLFCGDEFVNGLSGEQCDDGNNSNGDCCSATCRFEAASSPCEDGFFCTVNDTCTATGTCVTGIPNTCADTDACTADSCDEDLAVCVHAQTPRDPATCLVAPSAKFRIKNSSKPRKDKLSWQWSKGDPVVPEGLGAPEAGTGYTLCIYDKTATTASLKASIDIAPSATRWQHRKPSVVQYTDKAGASEGVIKAQLLSGDVGDTKVKIGAGGENLILPSPAGASFFRQEPNVVVQLVNSENICWTSQFAPDDTKDNSATLFRAQTK